MIAALALAFLSPQDKAPSPKPPRGAVVLFNGKGTDAWEHRGTRQPCQWEVEGGSLRVKSGTPDIVTKEEFGDYRLHLEFKLPLMPEASGQARANSGVYNHGRYEVQILDSWKNGTYEKAGCGAVYGVKDPDVDALKPPGEWNTYDIVLRSARLDAKGALAERPRLTVWHNGKLIHRDVEVPTPFTTAGIEGPWVARGPVLLQNHGCPVEFRNVWILETRAPD